MNKVHLQIIALFIMFMSIMTIANSTNDTNSSFNTSLNITNVSEIIINISENISEAVLNATTTSLVNESIQKEKDSIRAIKLNETNTSVTLSYIGTDIEIPVFRIEGDRIRYGVGDTITLSQSFLDENSTIEIYDGITLVIRNNYSDIEIEEQETVVVEIEEQETSIEEVTENITTSIEVDTNITSSNTTVEEFIINETGQQYRLDTKKEVTIDLDGLAQEIMNEVPEEIVHVSSKIITSEGDFIQPELRRINNTIELDLNESLPSGSYTLVSSLYYENKSHVHSIPLLVNAVKLSGAGVKVFNETYDDAIVDLRTSDNLSVQVEETVINDTKTIIIPEEGVIEQLVVNTENLNIIDSDYIGLDTNISNLTGINNETFVQAFAIDPEQSNITTIDITATAKGDALYKCVDWNFTTQTCFGEWKFVQSIVPGEQYTVTIDPVDPAFGEQASFLKMDWGLVSSISDSWVVVDLNQTYNRPVIIATAMYTSDGVPTVTRITNITQTSFEVRLQDTGGGTATTRDVSYFVIEEGVWTLPDGTNVEAFSYTSLQTDSDSDWTPVQQFPTTTFTTPIVLGQVMSFNDSEWSVFWASDGTQTGNVNPTQIYTGKHVGQDASTTRNNEEIGVVIFEADSGNVSGIEYSVYLSSDSVRGPDNGAPFPVSHPITFGTTPTVGLASANTMDGGNGGWPSFYNGITTTQANLVFDEYDSGERAHTPEPVAVLVLASPGTYSGNDPPIFIDPAFNQTLVEIQDSVEFSVNVTDPNDNNTITYVNATFRYPNATEIEIPLTQTTSGAPLEIGDLELLTQVVEAPNPSVTGETGQIANVSSWQTVNYRESTYDDPVVFVFGLNKSDRGAREEEAQAIITNVTSTGFRVANINASDLFIEDDIGYVVMERGVWDINGTTVQVGSWTYSGTAFVTRNFDQSFNTNPTVFIKIQDNSDNWYAGRYTASTLGTSSIDIQYEDGFNAFSETVEVGYIAFEQGSDNEFFAGDIETSVADDPGSGTFRTVTFPRTYDDPIVLGIVSEGGGDPTILGIGSRTDTSVDVRPTEETASDAEQNHATNDVLWMAFNNSVALVDENSMAVEDRSIAGATYENINSDTLNFISEISVSVNIVDESTLGSLENVNLNPQLDVELLTSSGWQSIGTLSGTGNKTRTTVSSSITTAWANDAGNRDVRISGLYFDYFNETRRDYINWTDVYVNIQAGNKTVSWKYIWIDTENTGTYNLTRLEASDGELTNVTTYNTISFTVQDTQAPEFTNLANITLDETLALLVDIDAFDISTPLEWSINDTTLFSINSSTGLLENATGLSLGIYTLNVTVNDSFENSNTQSIIVNITNVPDTTPPEFVPVLNTTNQSFGRDVYFDINATDDRGVLGIFWINDTLQFSINETTGELTNATTLAFGNYTINVSVNDSSGNVNSSTLTIILEDIRAPEFGTPTSIIIEFATALGYQINVSDDTGILNMSVDDSRFIINNSGYLENNSILAKGNYTFTITAEDNYENINSTSFTVSVQDTTAPSSVTNLTSTAQGFNWITWNWTNPTDIDFNFNIVYLDGINILNTSTNGTNITSLTPGTNYNLSIQTIDNDGNINTAFVSSSATTLSNLPPEVIIYAPLNLSASLDTYRDLNVSASDAESTNFCLTLRGSQNPSISNEHILYRDCNYANNTNITYNWSRPVLENSSSAEVLYHFDNNSDYGESDTFVNDFAGGTDHNLTCSGITCPTYISNGAIGGAFDYDSANTQAWSLTEQFFNDEFTVRSYQVWFKADTTTGTRYIYEEGGTTNGFAFKIQDNELQAASLDNFIRYNVTTSFTDTTDWHFLVVQYDTGNLSMYLDGLLVGSVDTSADYTSVSAHTDEGFLGGTTGGGAFGTESGSFDGQIDEFRITTTTLTPEEILNLSSFRENTTYYWSVEADDEIFVDSSEQQFFIEAPTADMTLLNLTYSSPIEGANSTVFAYINNTGTTIENSVLVEFIINETESINRTISTINPGEVIEVNISYLFELGTTVLNVTVDANTQIIETSETNNNIAENISVSSWETYYGTLDLETIIGNNANNSVFTWFDQSATGIIYALDSDASVNFANLYGLGQNISNENSTLDFSEADSALGLTGRFDSITSRFGLNESVALQTRNFSIGGFTISSVAVTNSTTSSTFQTGIMWDATSDTTGEYDENETLIFIANVEDRLPGLYGIYDFELSIPTSLETTEGVGSTIEIYVELE